MKPGRKPLVRTAAQVEELRRGWADGVPAQRIGDRIGVSGDVVTRTAARLGLPPRRRGISGPLVAEFVADWHAGVRVVDMARRFGVGQSTVSKTAARLGLPERPWSRVKRGPRPEPTPIVDESPGLEDGEWRRVRGLLQWVPANPTMKETA